MGVGNNPTETIFHRLEGGDGGGHLAAGEIGQAAGVSVAKVARLLGQRAHFAVDGGVVGAIEQIGQIPIGGIDGLRLGHFCILVLDGPAMHHLAATGEVAGDNVASSPG